MTAPVTESELHRLAGLAKLWAKQAAARAKQETKEKEEKAAAVSAKASPAPSPLDNDRPENPRSAQFGSPGGPWRKQPQVRALPMGLERKIA